MQIRLRLWFYSRTTIVVVVVHELQDTLVEFVLPGLDGRITMTNSR